MDEREGIEKAIAAQETLRPALGDAVVDAALAVLRERLAALEPRAPAEQRKQVTVLFADVSGFTALSETLDAEEVRDVMNALWARLDAVLTRHGGRIDKHIGDAVMALFGAAQAREDDPERAVLAALAMQKELSEFAAASRHPLRLRIGVNTGPVLLGAVGSTAEFTAMGDAVNLASRLEHAAPVGGVLIAHDTYALVRDCFDADALPPLEVKGKREPVQAYVVNKAKPRGLRFGVKGGSPETRMVGREAELKALQDAFYQAVEDREPQLATVLGDPGVGKSRLLYEFRAWLDPIPETAWMFMGRASAQAASHPYGLWRDVFSLRFDILDSDSPALVREKFENGVRDFLKGDAQAAEKAHFMGQLLGFDFSGSPHLSGIHGDAQQVQNRGLAYLGQFFAAASTVHAVLIVLEDVHWADDRSLDALSGLFASCPNIRMLCLCLARPTLLERRPSWGEGQAYHRRLDLKPISKLDCRRLVAAILGKIESVPQELRDLIVDGAEGNPFYVEELIRMLGEEGVIVKGGERWRVNAERMAGLKVPPTLTGVLQARLDSLPEAERGLLQRASVVGRTFWESAVERLGEAGTTELLAALRGKEMVFRRETSAFAGTTEFLFKHALLRDVAYETVLKRLRPGYHARVADWLAAQGGERVGEFAGLIAEHYERAGEGAKAAEFFEKAGARAFTIGVSNDAKAFFQRALALLAGEDRDSNQARMSLLRQLGQTHRNLGEFPQARSCFELTLRLARDCGDAKATAQALIGLGDIAYFEGRYAQEAEYAQEGLELSRRINDPQGISHALHELASVAHQEGRYADARSLFEESLRIKREIADLLGLGKGLNGLAMVCCDDGALDEAVRHYEEALAVFRGLGYRLGASRVLSNLGETLEGKGRYDDARRLFQESLAVKHEICDRSGIANTLDSLGHLSFRMKDYPEAGRNYRESLRMSKELGNSPGYLTTLAGLAQLHAGAGDMESAAALAGLVLAHPAARDQARKRAQDVLAELGPAMRPEALEAALARGRELALEEAIRLELSRSP